jgi:hypothetical protein
MKFLLFGDNTNKLIAVGEKFTPIENTKKIASEKGGA